MIKERIVTNLIKRKNVYVPTKRGGTFIKRRLKISFTHTDNGLRELCKLLLDRKCNAKRYFFIKFAKNRWREETVIKQGRILGTFET